MRSGQKFKTFYVLFFGIIMFGVSAVDSQAASPSLKIESQMNSLVDTIDIGIQF
jgi:hypothetical protein